MITLHNDTLLTRKHAAEELTLAGYPTSAASLATLASRGGGPAYRLYSKVALYKWADLLEWAEARCTPPRRNTSEADAMGNRTQAKKALNETI